MSPSGMLHYRPAKTVSPDDLYADRDPEAQGAHFLRHLDRMTVEGLHGKSAIAAELAHRDIERDKLKAGLNAALEIGLRCSAEGERLRVANAELVEALESSIELIEVLDGKDNSCEPKSDIGDLRAVLAKHQKEASCG